MLHIPLVEAEVGEEIIDGDERQVRALNGQEICIKEATSGHFSQLHSSYTWAGTTGTTKVKVWKLAKRAWRCMHSCYAAR